MKNIENETIKLQEPDESPYPAYDPPAPGDNPLPDPVPNPDPLPNPNPEPFETPPEPIPSLPPDARFLI